MASRLTDAINYEMDDKGLNAVSIVLVDDQEILLARGYGFEDLGKPSKADANTVYRVGSSSAKYLPTRGSLRSPDRLDIR